MTRLALALLIGCSGPAAPTPVAPRELPAASTACYSGVATGMGQTARTLARRTVDPAAGTITEEVSTDDGGAHGAKTFHVVMKVEGDQFTMTERDGAFTGTGTLAGEPWRWTSWTSTSVIPNTGITVESEDELTPTGMTAAKEIRKDGKVLAKTSEQLKSFDCADWTTAQAALAVPVLDAAACERACRNFGTVKYWARADAEIAALPPGEQAAARTGKQAELTTQLEAGVGACTTQCISANNAPQTACMGAAKTMDELTACE
ncbi:MAG: hypothetical protein JWP01_484 [Myxococcales bacterium]|nr:hypothetical protein [Myxococcales bacterium]